MDAAGSIAGHEGERRLKWRFRRATEELDVLLERYAAGDLPQADPAERAIFMKLLELPDPLLAYLRGRDTPPEPDLAALVRRIRAIPPRSFDGLGAPQGHSGSPDAAQASSFPKGPC